MKQKTAKNLQGTIIKAVGGLFKVRRDGKTYVCVARGKLHEEGLFVGDECLFTVNERGACIEQLLPRRNMLLRPSVANVNKVLIVTAPLPLPDFLLVDKIIINCIISGIDYAVVINKRDLADDAFITSVRQNYASVCDVVSVCSADAAADLESLSPLLGAGTYCLAGQSGVGKTSLINALLSANRPTGGLMRKINRGRQTTRHAELFEYSTSLFVDTPGFSLLDLSLDNLRSAELRLFYADFATDKRCHYADCTHDTEPDCEVKLAVARGEINADRYNRYIQLLHRLRQAEAEEF